ncbi:hypothetical protein HPB48_026608 [Haemaphysalis longicornis]|uniref:Uncharacterized protein n=1 Tax=Haemaphysalis longicornis TaxID=44386 RepID=A0A9J6H1J9_HAELO|nr:hypothetical protein HPB48_026608 [Haemaphysalis longicornis]
MPSRFLRWCVQEVHSGLSSVSPSEQLLVLAASAAPHPLCPARVVCSKLLRHRVWLDGGGTAQGGYSLGASSAAHFSDAATSTMDNTEATSTARPAPNKAPPKKAGSGGKPQKG